jgi:predicted CopG family antitoxin
MPFMKARPERTTISLRLPPDLYKKLVKAKPATRSLNQEIIERLAKSFSDWRNDDVRRLKAEIKTEVFAEMERIVSEWRKDK